MTNNFIKTLLLLLTLLAVQVNAANKVDALELASTIEEITNNSNIFTITPKNIINELPESFSANFTYTCSSFQPSNKNDQIAYK